MLTTSRPTVLAVSLQRFVLLQEIKVLEQFVRCTWTDAQQQHWLGEVCWSWWTMPSILAS